MRIEQETLGNKEIEVKRSKGKGDHESPKEESQIPKWMEKKLEKRTPTSKDPKTRLEAILACA